MPNYSASSNFKVPKINKYIKLSLARIIPSTAAGETESKTERVSASERHKLQSKGKEGDREKDSELDVERERDKVVAMSKTGK